MKQQTLVNMPSSSYDDCVLVSHILIPALDVRKSTSFC